MRDQYYESVLKSAIELVDSLQSDLNSFMNNNNLDLIEKTILQIVNEKPLISVEDVVSLIKLEYWLVMEAISNLKNRGLIGLLWLRQGEGESVLYIFRTS